MGKFYMLLIYVNLQIYDGSQKVRTNWSCFQNSSVHIKINFQKTNLLYHILGLYQASNYRMILYRQPLSFHKEVEGNSLTISQETSFLHFQGLHCT
jgi:hypothetical protein